MFIKIPGMPEGAVRTALVTANYCGMIAPALAAFGTRAVSAPYSCKLPDMLRYHPDMNLCHIGGERLVILKNAENTGPLERMGAEIIYALSEGAGEYPRDAALNIKRCGDTYFHRKDTTDPVLRSCLDGLRPIWVKQGYSGCSAVSVAEGALITSDMGILAAARSAGMDVLFADPRGIVLPGYSNGFIGGCAGKLAPDILAFTGIPDGRKEIEAFCARHGVKTAYLTEGSCIDIGGIIPLTQ